MSNRNSTTKKMTMKINETWRAIEADAQGTRGSAFLTRLLPGCRSRDFSLGMRLPDGERSLFFKVAQSAVPARSDLPDAAGFRVDYGQFPGEDKPSIVIVLQNEDFKSVFTVLLEDLVERLELARNDKECVAIMINRLAIWKSFMKGYRPEGLTPDEQRGLFGELHFLENCLIPRYGPRIVEAWVGPENANQDFHYNDCAVEVKTTVQKKPQHIRISNERQLDQGSFRHLFLWHISVDETQTAGETLCEKVKSVRELLGDSVPMQIRFTDKLNIFGYNESQTSMYSRVYAPRFSEFFLAGIGFPRIVEPDLMDGVGNIRYSISLDVCERFAVDENTFHVLLSAGAGDRKDGD